jgi:uncharacterized membrane protein YkoI
MRFKAMLAGSAAAVIVGSAVVMAGAGGPGFFGDDDSKVVAALPKSMHTIEDGIKQAAKTGETAISAKFEMEEEGGKSALSLSVYVAEKGLAVDAEHNVFKEIAGAPDSANWKTDTEVFKDVEHVSRSAEQSTIMAISKLTLLEVIAKAKKDQPGTVYSVIPHMRDRKAVFVVQVAAKDKTVELVYDALTGMAVKK